MNELRKQKVRGREAVASGCIVLCQYTNYPKLGYIIRRLTDAGIPCAFQRDDWGSFVSKWSFEYTLVVAEEKAKVAWEILAERWSAGGPAEQGELSLDDMPDDHPAFATYAKVLPTMDSLAMQLPIPMQSAGYGEPLFCVGLRSYCGKVCEGISFRFGEEGSWVVAWQDLEKVVAAARRQRELHSAD